ncbi:putative tocopherol C-methyltransferase [Helianthus annuus]|nr:putative tocopherol C-methyltransferase [Helianthus annuus]
MMRKIVEFGMLCTIENMSRVQGMHAKGSLLSRPCIWNEALCIVNEEGVRVFCKGNMVTIAHRLPYTVVNFYAYEQYKKEEASKKPWSIIDVGCGIGGSARYLTRKYRAECCGITLSPVQAERA